LLYVLLTSVIGRIIFHSDGVAIARRFAAISGCIYFLCSFVLISTSFPNPQLQQCQDYTPGWSFYGLIWGTCADRTGHTVSLVLAALCWGQYTKHKIVAVLAWIIALFGMVTLLITRSTYTINILFSMFISIFVWTYYHMSLALPLERRNRIVKWLEMLDFGAGSEEDPAQSLSQSFGSPVPTKYKELDESTGSPSVPHRLKELNASLGSPVPSRFMELTESLGSPGSSYTELSCVIKSGQ